MFKKKMGRGRAKAKRLTVTSHDDPGSGEEERIPAQKRRGRPIKPLKDDIEEDEVQRIEDDASEDLKSKTMTQNGKKRKRNGAQVTEKVDLMKEENGNGIILSTEELLNKPNSFRQSGNRRKSKPRRAAEAVVECN